MSKLFGTDGVRGLANLELTPELAFRLGRAGACVLTKEAKKTPKIIVGMDTRISGDMLEAALTAGMCSVGAKVYYAGIIPTPAIAYLVKHYEMDAGVVISASHSPMQDNGIKFFSSQGYKLTDSLQDEIEALMEQNPSTECDSLPRPTGKEIGCRYICENALQDYINFLKDEIQKITGVTPDELPGLFSGMKIAVDCANGATYQAAPIVLHELGAELYTIHNEPDGININAHCGSTHMESLCEYVKEVGADIGLAFDGDGDRFLCVDENSDTVNGDQIMSICGMWMKKKRTLAKDTIVATVMSNLGLSIMGEKNGINIEKTAVGDRYVLEKMLAEGYNFGGEESGHVIFLDHTTSGDGIFTALNLLAVLWDSGKALSELNTLMKVLPQFLENAHVANDRKADYSYNSEIQAAIRKLDDKYAGSGRVLIRHSGTEPLVRVMIEGENKDEIQADAKEMAALIEKVLK